MRRLQHCSILFMAIGIILFASCKKNSKTDTFTGDPAIISMVFGNGSTSQMSKDKKEVTMLVPDYLDRTKLVAIFQLSPGATAKVNGAEQHSSETLNDFSSPVVYHLTAGGKAANWTIHLESNTYTIGLGSQVQLDKRLNREYEWYQSQDTSGVFSSINGGAACLAMALYWASPLKFGHPTAGELRSFFALSPSFKVPIGNMLSTNDLTRYMTLNHLDFRLVNLTDDYSEVTEAIDRGYLVLLELDMSAIDFNPFVYQHINRFYDKVPAYSGHFILVKGYKKVDGNLYYETYDPYSLGMHYLETGEILGRNRYYSSALAKKAAFALNGFKYGIVIHDYTLLDSMFINNAPLKNVLSKPEMARVLDPLQVLYKYGY